MTEMSRLHSGQNEIDGIPVEVTRKRIRRINLHVAADGTVCLSVPKWWATLSEGEAFLREKWAWVLKVRGEVLARSTVSRMPVTTDELEALRTLLAELNETWSLRLREFNVAWEIRQVSSFWGSCRWGSRRITYNAELARVQRELVEYVVVHEYTHFAVHNHGPRFYALMDERLPGWQALRRRLNRREWERGRGNACGLPRLSPGIAATVFSGSHPAGLPEGADEVGLVVKAGLGRDDGEGLVGSGEELAGGV